MERTTQSAASARLSSGLRASSAGATRTRQGGRAVSAGAGRRGARAASIPARSAASDSRPPSLAQAARLASAALNADERRQAAQALVQLSGDAEADAADGLESWLGPAPSDPVALELHSLRQRFQLRRQVLGRTLGADEVADLLQTRSRQTAHDRAKAGTLLAIRDNGRLRFPLCQFDPEGPDGVATGLAEVLQTLHLSALAKAAWLERPHPALDGQSPIERLKQGELAAVLAAARRAGHGQD
jgi:hypothetical protein